MKWQNFINVPKFSFLKSFLRFSKWIIHSKSYIYHLIYILEYLNCFWCLSPYGRIQNWVGKFMIFKMLWNYVEYRTNKYIASNIKSRNSIDFLLKKQTSCNILTHLKRKSISQWQKNSPTNYTMQTI